jgi:hypothetical protein
LYGRRILENHDFRKKFSETGVRITPTNLHSEIIPGAEGY